MVKKFEIATVKEEDPKKFDTKVNTLIAEGYYLRKRKYVTVENQGLVFIAFLDRKTKIDTNNNSDHSQVSQKMKDKTPDILDPENPDFSSLELD